MNMNRKNTINIKERKTDVDNPKEFTVLEWCAGYGGIQLGLRRVIPNMRTIAYSEIEAFACSNLVAKMEAGFLDAAPIWTDLKTFPCREFHGKVDLLIAGYPCQPFSAAGKRQGAEDPRHLWPHIREAIRTIQPRQCFFENVEGHVSLGLSTVLSDLEEDGYRTTWGIFSAEEVGAPHRRKRVFILAYRSFEGLQGTEWERKTEKEGESKRHTAKCCDTWPSGQNKPQHGWEPTRVVGNKSLTNRKAQPTLGRNTDGAAGGMGYAELCESCDNQTDELRLLGNGVVPATVTKAWAVLSERLNNA